MPEKRNQPGGSRLNINAGGVCDNCGLPGFAHRDQVCLDVIPREMWRQIDAWAAIVEPAQQAYQRARKAANDQRRLHRRGLASALQAETAAVTRDQLLASYRAAIRRADLAHTERRPTMKGTDRDLNELLEIIRHGGERIRWTRDPQLAPNSWEADDRQVRMGVKLFDYLEGMSEIHGVNLESR